MLKKGVPFPHHSFLSLECVFACDAKPHLFSCILSQIAIKTVFNRPFSFSSSTFYHRCPFRFIFIIRLCSSHFGSSLLCASCLCLSCAVLLQKAGKMRTHTYFGFLSLVFPKGKFHFTKKKPKAMKRSRKIIMILTAWEIFDANFVMLSNTFTVKKKRNEFYVHLLSLSNACLPTYASMDAYVFDVILKYFPVDKLTNKKGKRSSTCVLSFVRTRQETEDKAFNCNQIMHADHVCVSCCVV